MSSLKGITFYGDLNSAVFILKFEVTSVEAISFNFTV